MLRLDPNTIDLDVDALIMSESRSGIAILPWGSPIPRAGDSFEYEEDGSRFVLEAVRYHPRSPTARMRRFYERPDYWLTVRLVRLVELEVPR